MLNHIGRFEKCSLYPQERVLVVVCSIYNVENEYRKSQSPKLPGATTCLRK